MSNYKSFIPEAKKNIKRTMKKANEKASDFVVAEVKKNMLAQGIYDTGNLLNSYHAVVSEERFDVGSDENYAAYNEFGTGEFAEGGGRTTPWAYRAQNGNWYTTSGMRPRPHLRPAFENNVEEIKRIIAEEMKDIE